MTRLQLTFRLARPNDFDEVLKLSEGIYDGHDYLPFRYHAWMKMDNLNVMLAYYEKKLVGLAVCSVVDEGKTAIRRAARTLAEFRGQGVYSQLSHAMNEFIRRKYPRVRQLRFTSYQSFTSLSKLFQVDILSCYAKRNTLRSHHFSAAKNSIQIEDCTKEYLNDVIFSSPQAKKLFPNNVIILEFFPVEPRRSNIDYWQQEVALYFAVEKCADGAFPRSVSFGVLSPRVKTVHWYVTVYTCDPVLYETHLLYQFMKACEVIDDDFIFDCLQDKSLTNHGRRVLQERLKLELDEKMSKMSIKLYENKL